MAEVVAGRLAAELEIETLRRNLGRVRGEVHSVPSQSGGTIKLPAATSRPILRTTEEWDVAGWQAEPQSHSSFNDWHALGDGRMLVAAGATYPLPDGTQSLIESARIALRSLAPQAYDAGELLTSVNRT